ncbi:hypothetical protein A3759_17010 [Thalassolituus sp. HI0120]|nr:hypothetical protein A3759_17010 [Thalassolituus sp. HI0120]
MKPALLIIIFILSFVFLVASFSIDACMDAGGLWSNLGFSCTGAHEEFVPQYIRAAPFFWGLVIFISGIVTLFIKKVLPSAKP